MTDANELSATQARAALDQGKLSPMELYAACRARIEAREDTVKAWCHLPETGGDLDAPLPGPLSGLPVGVKDIIDTVDMPTTYGSAAYADYQPGMDAACVALTKAAGGIVMGKTVTTEFAYFQPGKTANPHNPGHTPGGSSSGSAAAVADCMVPFAFGTQTGGSVIRPAAYCGVVGYKATRGSLPLYGVKALSHDLDTLGWFCREVADIHLMRAALVGAPVDFDGAGLKPKVGLCRTHEWDEADADGKNAVEAAAKCLAAAGAEVVEVELPAPFGELVEQQKLVMAQNAARDLAFEYQNHLERISPHIIGLIEQGQAVEYDSYLAALAAAEQGRRKLNGIFGSVDVLLCPSAPGEAPAGLDGTGDPVFNRMWTLLGNPCINLPGHTGARGLPVGVQAVGVLGGDEKLLAHCRWMEQRIV